MYSTSSIKIILLSKIYGEDTMKKGNIPKTKMMGLFCFVLFFGHQEDRMENKILNQ